MFKLNAHLTTCYMHLILLKHLIFVGYQLICYHIKCWIYYIIKKSKINLVMFIWVLFVLEFQFPIGIDSHRFIRALDAQQVQDRINELKRTFTGRKVGSVLYDVLLL